MRRILLALVCTAALSTVVASTASATGTFNTTVIGAPLVLVMQVPNPQIVINIAPNQQRTILCQAMTITGTAFANGTMTIPAGGIAAAGCTLNGVAVGVLQTVAINGLLRHLRAAGAITVLTLDLNLGAGAITVAGPMCNLTLGGGALGAYVLPAPVPVGGVFNVPSIVFPAALDAQPLDLVVNGAIGAGCPIFGFAAGQSGRVNARAAFSPTLTGTG